MISLALKATKMTVIIILMLMGINGAHASTTIEEDADSVRVVERCESIENITDFPGGFQNIPNKQVQELILREGGWEDNLTRLMNLVRVTVSHHINTHDGLDRSDADRFSPSPSLPLPLLAGLSDRDGSRTGDGAVPKGDGRDELQLKIHD